MTRIFLHFVILLITPHQILSEEYEDEELGDPEPPQLAFDIKDPQTLKKLPNAEDFYPMYYVIDQSTPELLAHSNKVIPCRDHSLAKHICAKANTSSLCYEKEPYAFSFCRKSCGFCEEVNSLKHILWRVVPGTGFRPTWPVSDLRFYSKYPVSTEPLEMISSFASSSYDGYSHGLAIDNRNETYWMPEEWGLHDMKTDWIGVSLLKAESVNAISIKLKRIDGMISPTILHIESSNNSNDPFIHRWSLKLDQTENDDILVKPSCPPLWKIIDVNQTFLCIRFFGTFLNWDQANLECRKHNSDLISFMNREHHSIFMSKYVLRGPTWIGLNDKAVEGKYAWSDGSNVAYTNWDSDPTDELRNPEEDCVYISHDGYYQSAHCHDKHFFACQKPSEKFIKPTPDPREPEVKPPIVFDPHDFLNPIISTSDTENISINSTINWPVETIIPITMNENTTLYNKPQLKPMLAETISKSQPVNIPEVEKIESPIHRLIEKKRRDFKKILPKLPL